MLLLEDALPLTSRRKGLLVAGEEAGPQSPR